MNAGEEKKRENVIAIQTIRIMNFRINGYKMTGNIRNNNPPGQKINNHLSNK